MASTQAAIVDRIEALIEALDRTSLIGNRLRASRNEDGADFQEWAEQSDTAALRRFQAIDIGDEDPPEVSNTTTDLRHFTVTILVAYPHTARYGSSQALDRRRVMNEDWGRINGTAGIGIYGRANFSGDYDCTPLGADREVIRGASCDFLEIRARFSYYRNVTFASSAWDASFSADFGG